MGMPLDLLNAMTASFFLEWMGAFKFEQLPATKLSTLDENAGLQPVIQGISYPLTNQRR
jgi:hypothetical protein